MTHRGVAALTAVWLAMTAGAGAASTWPFFAFCMDTHDAKKRSLQEQAGLLKELGYDGCGHLWLDQAAERLQTLDAAGLKLYQVYLRLDVAPDAKQPFDPRLKEVLPLLKGRGTQVALLLQGGRRSDESLDPHVVELLRRMASMAEPHGVQLVLYPHSGDWLETVQDAIRVAGKVDRPNVGAMFNLCHWLRVSKDRDYQPLLAKAMPRLWAVSINGADEFDEKPGWARYIQPLGRGSFDMLTFLKTLRQLGYTDPVGLQCYGIQGDVRDTLAESMKAWRSYQAALLK
jgi:sugar phosphate isomerase/epimerase